MGLFVFGEGGGCGLGDELAAFVAGFGAEVDHPIRLSDQIQIVLHDDHRVALVHQAMQHLG